MALLGRAIKGALKFADKLRSDVNHIEAQKQVLKQLLDTAKTTDFGKQYQFSDILKSDDIEKSFTTTVPYFDYNQIYDKWWSRVLDGEENVTWPGEPNYFALSSGTTGKTSKRIPVTEAMLDAIKNAGIKQVLSLNNFNMSPEFFEKDIMMLGSSTDLNERMDHRLEGEISGISASNIPFWFQPYYKPGKDIAKIEDWDTRVERIAKNAKDWDVGALSGIPSWIELMLEKVISHNHLNTIHDIWPNLEVFTSGGVAFGPYEKSFNALMGKPVTVIDTYLASEGYIATQVRPNTDAMQLNTDHGIYFEFVPFKPEYINPDGSLQQNAPSITLEDVETGTDYVLIISTVSGTWRYLIGDTITFTDVDRAEIKITGRTKFFLNTVGSQLSVNKMDDAMRHLEEIYDTKIKEYTIAAVREEDDKFYHHWYLGTEMEAEDNEVATTLDDFLKEANKNYAVARGKALEGVKVNCIHPRYFYNWNALNKKKGGQVKMERVMGEDRFREWQEFLNS